jgi:hypothetical protein
MPPRNKHRRSIHRPRTRVSMYHSRSPSPDRKPRKRNRTPSPSAAAPPHKPPFWLSRYKLSPIKFSVCYYKPVLFHQWLGDHGLEYINNVRKHKRWHHQLWTSCTHRKKREIIRNYMNYLNARENDHDYDSADGGCGCISDFNKYRQFANDELAKYTYHN